MSVTIIPVLINGGPGLLFLRLFTRSFHSLWTFTHHGPITHQNLARSYCRFQHTPAQSPSNKHPQAPDVPRKV